jgi:hypothetical protein
LRNYVGQALWRSKKLTKGAFSEMT